MGALPGWGTRPPALPLPLPSVLFKSLALSSVLCVVKLILDFAVFGRWSLFSQLSLYTASTDQYPFSRHRLALEDTPRLTSARTAPNTRSSHRNTVYYECMRRNPRSGDGSERGGREQRLWESRPRARRGETKPIFAGAGTTIPRPVSAGLGLERREILSPRETY
ncbi:hypothetical protein B0H11DRAFT_2427782 [Mycena galericulata]|nr:hypothetical protein B0H11DRAFT_2366620 [Mycena galericulata]KAJ7509379.1 hypothetical protein B0H11DRAFT_2427782 [Mycena galericulata]